MDFRSKKFLTDHIQDTLLFYKNSVDENGGGFYQFYKDDGTVYDKHTRHLVSSTRFVYNYAMAYLQFKKPDYLQRVKHGLDYIRNVHRNPKTGGYAWVINDGKIVDDTNHCYGFAFVVLAYACGVKVGIEEARQWIAETFDTMEKHFWLPDFGLYASEASVDWKVANYRGQNDNMHSCEAMIAAYEATKEQRYLDRANILADNMVNRQAKHSNGQVWEHFKDDWSPDLEYNKNVRTNIFRPWGIQTGHQTEWAKLLLILDRYTPLDWHLSRAKDLFDRAMKYGWDKNNDGLMYGYDLDGNPYDEDKYFWVQAESLAAAALLADRTNDEHYWQWYDKIWKYSWNYFIDHEYGAWYRILTPDNKKISDEKSPAGKTDYHTMGVCYEVLNVIKS